MHSWGKKNKHLVDQIDDLRRSNLAFQAMAKENCIKQTTARRNRLDQRLANLAKEWFK